MLGFERLQILRHVFEPPVDGSLKLACRDRFEVGEIDPSSVVASLRRSRDLPATDTALP